MKLSYKLINIMQEIKKYIEFNRLIIFPVLTLILYEVCYWYFKLYSNEIFNSTQQQSLHFNILSTNAILAGFLFTGLSIIVSTSNNKIIKILSEWGHLDLIHTSISRGIFLNLGSIVVSFIAMINSSKKIQIFLVNIELLLLILGVCYFFMSILDLKFIINKIREYDLEKDKKDIEVYGIVDDD
ncbi:hypothetical protein SAMN00017405_0430 [Desulfonispora thiosulfatigenes DSM 11270]|uniref:Uncharacterized protein n=1 Tax=Desulfonispora thiosulfatigenes DSM 11270 TaxID=656914 RepID=A0A1W1VQL5_DESTI|nr:hypothetical protein [Desulfonispora thiosulfatigenes]SMB95563.1 hypothetical protein SAMN00017405_0430 [Desulfonispora thiosulfatigenes DSM 11270]